MLSVILLALTAVSQVQATHRYVPVDHPKPGLLCYAETDAFTELIPIAADYLAEIDLQKSLISNDVQGVRELTDEHRVYWIKRETPIKLLAANPGSADTKPAYEIRILEGRRKDEKGWIFAGWARERKPASQSSQSKVRPRTRKAGVGQ